MSASVEDLLREALRAKAAQVTDDRLLAADAQRRTLTAGEAAPSDMSRLDPETHEVRTARHARWFAPTLAVAAVAVVAVAATVITASVHDSAPAPVRPAHSTSVPAPSVSPTPSPTPTHATASPTHTTVSPTHTAIAPVMLGNGRQGERTSVPWSLVGTGWTVALWTPDLASSSEPRSLQTALERLYLVDPLGGRYLITELPANTWQLMDFSGDGHRALLMRYVQPLGSSRLAEVDLQTGALGNEIDPGPDLSAARYTKPLGKAIVVTDAKGLRKIGLDGGLQLTVPAGPDDVLIPLYSPDGTTFLVNGSSALRLYSNSGPLIREIKPPAGTESCVPIRWSTATVAIVRCVASGTSITGIWLVPIDGGTPTALAAGATAGHTNAALFGSLVIAEGDDEQACIGSVGILRGTGFTTLTLPGYTGSTSASMQGVTTSSVRISLNIACRQTALLSYDPITGDTTTLLGGSLDGGTILGSVLYRGTDPKD